MPLPLKTPPLKTRPSAIPLPSATLPSVLIVDSSADNREVLRTVLARRGMQVLEAEAAEEGLTLAHEHRPDVIVLDLEAERPDAASVRQQFAGAARNRDESVIVIGKICRGPTLTGSPAFTGGHVISKPYHFAPLIHTIEQLAAKAV